MADNVHKLRGGPQDMSAAFEEFLIGLRQIKQVLDQASDRLATCKKIADDAEELARQEGLDPSTIPGQCHRDSAPSS